MSSCNRVGAGLSTMAGFVVVKGVDVVLRASVSWGWANGEVLCKLCGDYCVLRKKRR